MFIGWGFSNEASIGGSKIKIFLYTPPVIEAN